MATTPASSPSQPASTSQTKPSNVAGVTVVPTTPPRKVTYIFNATSSSNLRIPYAVAVNGAAQAAFSSKPKRVNGSGIGNKIEIFVDQCRKVGLFLNSDAHPAYRQHSVYEVTVGENDIEVRITEKSGKHTDTDAPILQAAKEGENPPIDRYTAPLTGDIWMKVSHKYQASEVDALIDSSTTDEIKNALKSIYNGLESSTLTIIRPKRTGLTLSPLLAQPAASPQSPQEQVQATIPPLIAQPAANPDPAQARVLPTVPPLLVHPAPAPAPALALAQARTAYSLAPLVLGAQPESTLKVIFRDSNNPKQNISAY